MEADSNASKPELALTVIAVLATSQDCAGAIAELHLVPQLLRMLPSNPTALGPLLKTLFAHAVVVEEVGRIGGMVDILVLFAGGSASGPMVSGHPGWNVCCRSPVWRTWRVAGIC